MSEQLSSLLPAGKIFRHYNRSKQKPKSITVPANFDTTEFTKDSTLFGPLESVALASANSNQFIQDTSLAVRSDLLMSILDIYACAKANNRGGRYQVYVDYMKAHFARPRLSKTPPTPPTH